MGSSAFVGALAFQSLIVCRLWNRSQFLSVIALVLAILAVLSPFAAAWGGPMNAGLILFVALSLAQAAVLCAPQVLAFIWSRPRLP
jgi:hypothetical protein